MIDKTLGPTSDTLNLIGWPFTLYTSQNLTGNSLTSKSLSFKFLTLFSMFSLYSPFSAVPDKSPLTSAMNTGTPASEKLSAITFEVIVLPVPDAPVIKPCLFARFRSKHDSTFSFLPIKILFSLIITLPLYNLYYNQY